MPKFVVVLLVWFLWATGKDLDALVRFSITTDYYILLAAGVPWLFFAMGSAVFLLDTATVYYLYRPQPAGLRVLLNALAAGAVQNLATIAFALPNLANVREAYAGGRELRGLPVRQAALDAVFTADAMVLASGVMLGLYGVIAYIAYRKKDYFYAAEAV